MDMSKMHWKWRETQKSKGQLLNLNHFNEYDDCSSTSTDMSSVSESFPLQELETMDLEDDLWSVKYMRESSPAGFRGTDRKRTGKEKASTPSMEPMPKKARIESEEIFITKDDEKVQTQEKEKERSAPTGKIGLVAVGLIYCSNGKRRENKKGENAGNDNAGALWRNLEAAKKEAQTSAKNIMRTALSYVRRIPKF